MLWRPVTPGEQVFQDIYRAAGRHIDLTLPTGEEVDFLVSPTRFTEFTRLVATLELFLRCIRCAGDMYANTPHAAPTDFGKSLWRIEKIPSTLYKDRKFCEATKRTAQICHDRKRYQAIENNILKSATHCYLCGIKLGTNSAARDYATIEHIWPLSLGGETIEGNLIAACKDCNDKRQHSVTWAWGPVQSTYHRHQRGRQPPSDLRLSLGMVRLMAEAAGQGTTGGSQITLKQAAQNISPVIPNIQLGDERPRVYFELLDRIEGER